MASVKPCLAIHCSSSTSLALILEPRPAWLHTLVGPEATAYVIDPTRSGAVADTILGSITTAP
jgi:hypothetical protein